MRLSFSSGLLASPMIGPTAFFTSPSTFIESFIPSKAALPKFFQ